jgi:hypothetical protein
MSLRLVRRGLVLESKTIRMIGTPMVSRMAARPIGPTARPVGWMPLVFM